MFFEPTGEKSGGKKNKTDILRQSRTAGLVFVI